MSDRGIAPNVAAFLERAAALYGQLAAFRFEGEMFNSVAHGGTESPIEDLFWIAAHALCASAYVDLNPDPIGAELPPGIRLAAQQKIGKYRVDFLVTHVPLSKRAQPNQAVVVELDGHAYHDKDARQRAYEKARDRYLVAQGYRVLHFTGSEVASDPFRVAHEVLSLFDCFSGRPYDPADPLDIPQ